jgi:YidC/Oxa1 family membrane protein insertase
MEKRALIAIVLSVAVLLAWQVWFGAPPPAPPGGERAAPAAPAPEGGPAPSGGAPGVAVEPIPLPQPVSPGGPVTPVAEVETPLYRASFAADGSVTGWTLEYRGHKPLAVGGPFRPLAVTVQRGDQAPEIVPLRPEAARVVVTAAEPLGRLVFRGATASGQQVRRTLEFRAESYRIRATLQLDGARGAAMPAEVVQYWTTPVALPGPTRDAPWHTLGVGPDGTHLLGRILIGQPGHDPVAFQAPAPALKDPKESPGGAELKEPSLVPDGRVVGEAPWAALEDDYFIAAVTRPAGAGLTRGRTREMAQVGVAFRDVQAPAGASWEGSVDLYVGPKEWERLRALGVGLESAQARNYGQFLWVLFPMWWFCVPLLWLMNFFGTWLPGQNYGVAIILLTVLVKVAFFPLSLKSMRSMKQMQALQPQLNALRAKYRSEPQRFQREQMELFRKHRVNPMGGCLPMVVQIPIFYALYLTLQYSVELQGAPFLLWIQDLSKKDPYYVLPILMGISMLVQQKMTPTVGDPRQAQIMLIMPVIFTFMFLEFPTGLVLYWLVNNVLSIGQQYLIDRSTAPAKAVEREARRA